MGLLQLKLKTASPFTENILFLYLLQTTSCPKSIQTGQHCVNKQRTVRPELSALVDCRFQPCPTALQELQVASVRQANQRLLLVKVKSFCFTCGSFGCLYSRKVSRRQQRPLHLPSKELILLLPARSLQRSQKRPSKISSKSQDSDKVLTFIFLCL